MASYEIAFFGGSEPLPNPIRFEATDDNAAIERADEVWERGTYTTTAKGYTLRNVANDAPFHVRDRRNA